MGGTQCFKNKNREQIQVIKSNQVPQKKFSFGESQSEYPSKPKIVTSKAKKPTKVLQKYTVIKLCGVGFYSKVYLCSSSKSPNSFYAIKTLKKKKFNDPKSLSHISTELSFVENLSSPYIVNLVEKFEMDSRQYLVYPYYNLDIFNLIKLSKMRIPENIIKVILSQVYCGLSYLHSQHIIYRDLKPENIIVDTSSGFVKIIDFGLSSKIENDNIELHEICGTNEYIPPEVINGSGYNYDFDYWTFGIFTYELVFGHPPFKGSNQSEIFNDILKKQIKVDETEERKVSNEMKDLLKYMLKKEREERMEWVNIPYHPFFKGIDFFNKDKSNKSQEILKQFVEQYKDYSPFVVDNY